MLEEVRSTLEQAPLRRIWDSITCAFMTAKQGLVSTTYSCPGAWEKIFKAVLDIFQLAHSYAQGKVWRVVEKLAGSVSN